jgi:predicted dehydrogenase
MDRISSLMMVLHYSGKYMTIKKIALIGAGQLGSRHLQGLAKLKEQVQIEVVEPVASAMDVAKERFFEVSCDHHIELFEQINQLSDKLDLVIIATNSDVRADIVRELLREKIVKNLILEKVLFQKLADYSEIGVELGRMSVNTWVNHARRTLPFYKKLKTIFKGAESIHMSVTGGGWGLACNGLHFIDLLSYLSGKDEMDVYGDLLDSKIHVAKRRGFKEVTGVLTGKLGGSSFSIHCLEELAPITINLTSSESSLIINESLGEYDKATKGDGWKWKNYSEKIVSFQSELTTGVVEEIFENNRCDLPKYRDSQKLHEPFIKLLMGHIGKYDNNQSLDFCPIT